MRGLIAAFVNELLCDKSKNFLIISVELAVIGASLTSPKIELIFLFLFLFKQVTVSALFELIAKKKNIALFCNTKREL